MALIELDRSPTVEYTADGIIGRRFFHCLWSERFAVKPNIGDDFPGVSGLRCSRVRLEPLGQIFAGGNYAECRIVAEYTTADYVQQHESEDYVKESLDISGEVKRIYGGTWSVNEEAISYEQAISVFYPEAEYVAEVTVDDINEWLPRLFKNTGKINSSIWKGGTALTWLFLGATTSNFQDENGNMKWILSLRFLKRFGGITWQEEWHPLPDSEGGGRWEEPTFSDEGKLYKTTNFNSLFRGLI